MYEHDGIKTFFMTKHANYQYNVMLFRFNNIRETHQRMINKTFQEEIGETLGWYIYDMIIESN